MKKFWVILPVLAVVALGAWFFSAKPAPVNVGSNSNTAATSTPSTAWVTVDSDSILSVSSASDSNGRKLVSGDEILPGMIIKSDASGKGSINFVDGSTIRIEPNTTLKINEASFEENSGSLKVRVALTTGKIWSKITALATPESHWEVKTASAVATVRGSAFGTEVTDQGTLIVGSEHNISVTPLDGSGNELADSGVTVADNDTAFIGNNGQLTKDKKANHKEIVNWVKDNESKDIKLREKIIELKNDGLDGQELRTEIKKFVTENKDQDQPPTTPKQDDSTQKVKQDDTSSSPSERTNPNSSSNSNTNQNSTHATLVSIDVKTSGGLNVTEGADITFKAVGTFSDGSTQDLTSVVDWQVVGSIGKMSAPGAFHAALGDDVTEIGTAFGAVTATLKSDQGPVMGKSSIITVHGAVDTSTDNRG